MRWSGRGAVCVLRDLNGRSRRTMAGDPCSGEADRAGPGQHVAPVWHQGNMGCADRGCTHRWNCGHRRCRDAAFLSQANLHSAPAQTIRRVLLGTDPMGYEACCVALRDLDFTESLARIKTPTLVIGSDHDPSTPWEGNGSILASKIPNADSAMLAGAHLSNLEQPSSFTTAEIQFLTKPASVC